MFTSPFIFLADRPTTDRKNGRKKRKDISYVSERVSDFFVLIAVEFSQH